MARKLIILGRELGLPLERAEVRVESLVPQDLAAGGSDEFLARLPGYDALMAERYQAATARGKSLRYVGQLTASCCK